MGAILYNLFFVGVGVVLLTKGADWLITGSVGIARKFGVSSMIVGLTLVAFGTSAPELAATLVSAAHGKGDIAFGNVVGSNICNIGLILGVAALIKPIKVERSTLKREIPFMIAASVIIYIFAFNSIITRWMGFILLAGFVIFLYHCAKNAQDPELKGENQKESPAKLVTYVVVGGIGLVIGAELFLRGAVNLARILGISEAIISLSLVALGTSLPELSASLVATWKKEPSIALGNVIGSNIFNILLVGGATATICPFKISGDFIYIGLPVMLALAVLLAPFAWTRKKIGRVEGGIFLALYITYIVWLYGIKH
ncbi:MAG TPA: calcium/sodium antiporter [Deltaproteobacteria bacterium]|nr:MAG: sodium:calcium antiporter [Deltaproteobacteria bacterium]HEC32594.1 calcium/sodium antiporter [Deltaproteobacteria bacterium]